MKCHHKTTISLIFFLLNIFLSTAYADNTWRLDKDVAGIAVYTRAVQGSPIREFKAEVVIDASLVSLLAVFADIKNFPKWNHQCSQAAPLKRVNLYERYHYQNMNLPFPVNNRDLIIHSKMVKSNKGVTIYSSIAKDFCSHNSHLEQCKKLENSDNVRVQYSKGIHQFIPQKSGGVKLIWQQHVDPAGKIPTFLINTLLIDVPYKTLQKLRQLVKLDKYQKVKLEQILDNKF